MRTRVFTLSFLVHATAIGGVIGARILAPTGFPDPPRSTSFMMAAAEVPPDVQPSPAPRTPAKAAAANPNAVPVEAPDSNASDPRDIPDVVPSDGSLLLGLGQFTQDIIGLGPAAPAPPPQRVGGLIRPAQKIHHVPPVYPELARASRVTGTVILEALIGEEGSVREVKVLKSVPLLDGSAIDAVRQWRYMPTLLNGIPVQIIMSVTVTFRLN